MVGDTFLEFYLFWLGDNLLFCLAAENGLVLQRFINGDGVDWWGMWLKLLLSWLSFVYVRFFTCLNQKPLRLQQVNCTLIWKWLGKYWKQPLMEAKPFHCWFCWDRMQYTCIGLSSSHNICIRLNIKIAFLLKCRWLIKAWSLRELSILLQMV